MTSSNIMYSEAVRGKCRQRHPPSLRECGTEGKGPVSLKISNVFGSQIVIKVTFILNGICIDDVHSRSVGGLERATGAWILQEPSLGVSIGCHAILCGGGGSPQIADTSRKWLPKWVCKKSHKRSFCAELKSSIFDFGKN